MSYNQYFQLIQFTNNLHPYDFYHERGEEIMMMILEKRPKDWVKSDSMFFVKYLLLNMIRATQLAKGCV